MRLSRWFCFVGTLVAAVSQPQSVRGQLLGNVRSPNSWQSSGRLFQRDSVSKNEVPASKSHRLICEVLDQPVYVGTKLRLFLGVEHISGDAESLVNPFGTDSFPSELRVAIFDEQNRFLQWVPEMDEPGHSGSDSACASLELGELRGKYVDIELAQRPSYHGELTAPLRAGTYKAQLIACRRFFMGAYVTHSAYGATVPRMESRSYEEAARSPAASFQVLHGPPAPATPQIGDGKIHAVLEIEKPGGSDFFPFKLPQAKLTLTNLTDDEIVGIIDPFIRMRSCTGGPVTWTVRRIEEPDRQTHRPRGTPQRSPLHSDFVILPPRGVTSSRVGIVPQVEGRYKIAVDLLGGIVVEPRKIQMLRDADPSVGYKLGGTDDSVLRSDSVTHCEFVFE